MIEDQYTECVLFSPCTMSKGMVGMSRPCSEVEEVPGSTVGCGEGEGPCPTPGVGERQVVGKAGGPVLMDELPCAQSEAPSFPLTL